MTEMQNKKWYKFSCWTLGFPVNVEQSRFLAAHPDTKAI